MARHYDLGIEGEKLAVNYLLKKDYQILDTNWRYLKAEIDIIAIKENTLIIVEVKTRSYNYINPINSINQKKQKLLIKAANEYIIKNNIQPEVQFDIISIVKGQQIEHIQNAFIPLL